ncbi:DUF5682 family protein [Streptomyces sp. CMSTAAHL-2]|uniref:DUF5682 family protein n=1 Tax=Streptomyces sp. CMSTAAHL-2 TaxID=2904522 RepID=UPI001E380390|nr:DUF5682 family protein [Streptomyces sp. CMSTAAHL-2]MCE3034404.1 DUF5682 family protein [Streptomyces sp. CMSTAAHL-2]
MTGAGPLLLGVRHHGPGSARAVRAALDAARPAAVLIEGPPEADALIPLAADPGLRPPVALLAHAVDEPGRSAFWPFAAFSPEWVAVRWALEHGVPARFIDLPAAHTLAWDAELPPEEGESEATEGEQVRVDPLAALAGAAGYDDPERWWEDAVEHRGTGERDPFAPFEALAEAMGALRERYGAGGRPRDLVREAQMRLRLRAARKEFGDAVAVVCGAWHVPALRERTTVTADRALLKGLPKVKTELTWVPWTHRRLARSSGYGAGIDSPGWYGHLFHAPDRPVERWLTKVAGLLREEDRIVSSAHVIEAVRLADTLAAMRGRPLPGLGETTDAVRAVMCDGSDVPLALVHDRLVVGDVLGEVPESAPAVPLQRDLVRRQRSLRLKPEALERELELDLRGDTDAGRSRLLHRLRLLGIGWGEPGPSRESTGTFRETWRLRWEPELSVRVAEAGVWGTTVAAAARARAEADAEGAGTLADVTALAERCLLAGLPDALPAVMRALADRAALDTDVGHLAQALPALVRSLRYGDVRGTDTHALSDVAAALAERIFVGLPPACTALDSDAAEQMRGHVDAVHRAVGLLGEALGSATGADPGAASGTGGAAGAAEGADAEGAGSDRVGGSGGAGPDGVGGPEGAGGPEGVRGLDGAGPEAAGGPGGAGPEGMSGPEGVGGPDGAGSDGAEGTGPGEAASLGAVADTSTAPTATVGTGESAAATPAPGTGGGVASSPAVGADRSASAAALSHAGGGAAATSVPGAGGSPVSTPAPAAHGGTVSPPDLAADGGTVSPPAPAVDGSPASPPDPGAGASGTTAPALGIGGRVPSVPEGPAPGVGGSVPPVPESPDRVRSLLGLRRRWRAVLRGLAGRDSVAGVVRGRAVRLLMDEGELGAGEAARLMGVALSRGTPPLEAAAWIEGFVGGGGGMLLVHDERLLGLVDSWLTGVPAEAFTDVLPLLRRTFAAYDPGVRRTLGELVRRGPGGRGGPAARGPGAPGFGVEPDAGRADAVRPVLRLLLGTETEEENLTGVGV